MSVRHYVALTLLAGALHNQAGPQALKPRNALLPEEFSQLVGVRELRDGRVLLGDRKETRLVVAELATNAVTAVGGVGSGPGEYKEVAHLVALGGDSTLLVDGTNYRWLLLDGSSIVATVPPDAPAFRAVFAGRPDGADRLGHLLSRGCWGRSDSTCILLVDRSSGRQDRIGSLLELVQRSSVRAAPAQEGKAGGFAVTNSPARTGEQALLFPDGWTAVARLDPYRIDWRTPQGDWLSGAPVPYREIRFDSRERAAYAQRRPGWRNASASVWPEFAPPFELSALIGSPDGSLLVRRFQSATETGMTYDVVDRAGKLRRSIRLSKGEYILGFGERSVYVVVTDEDGIERVARHPWP